MGGGGSSQPELKTRTVWRYKKVQKQTVIFCYKQRKINLTTMTSDEKGKRKRSGGGGRSVIFQQSVTTVTVQSAVILWLLYILNHHLINHKTHTLPPRGFQQDTRTPLNLFCFFVSQEKDKIILPHSSSSQRCRKLHQPQSAFPRWGRPENAPSPPAAAACSPEIKEKNKRKVWKEWEREEKQGERMGW